MKRCGRCEQVYYCCQAHQEKNWPVHQAMCKCTKKHLEEMAREAEEHPLGRGDELEVEMTGKTNP